MTLSKHPHSAGERLSVAYGFHTLKGYFHDNEDRCAAFCNDAPQHAPQHAYDASPGCTDTVKSYHCPKLPSSISSFPVFPLVDYSGVGENAYAAVPWEEQLDKTTSGLSDDPLQCCKDLGKESPETSLYDATLLEISFSEDVDHEPLPSCPDQSSSCDSISGLQNKNKNVTFKYSDSLPAAVTDRVSTFDYRNVLALDGTSSDTIVKPYCEETLSASSIIAFFVVCDGHDGMLASEFVANNLRRTFLEVWNNFLPTAEATVALSQRVCAAYCAAFLALEQSFRSVVTRKSYTNQKPVITCGAGTCTVSVAVVQDYIFCANLGDCGVVFLTAGSADAGPLTASSIPEHYRPPLCKEKRPGKRKKAKNKNASLVHVSEFRIPSLHFTPDAANGSVTKTGLAPFSVTRVSHCAFGDNDYSVAGLTKRTEDPNAVYAYDAPIGNMQSVVLDGVAVTQPLHYGLVEGNSSCEDNCVSRCSVSTSSSVMVVRDCVLDTFGADCNRLQEAAGTVVTTSPIPYPPSPHISESIDYARFLDASCGGSDFDEETGFSETPVLLRHFRRRETADLLPLVSNTPAKIVGPPPEVPQTTETTQSNAECCEHSPDTLQCYWLTTPHRASMPSEAERIISLGGKIEQGRIAGLEPSRTIGDFDVKDCQPSNVLSVTPEVTCLRVQQPGLLIIASDGVWDNLSCEAIVALLRKQKKLWTRIRGWLMKNDTVEVQQQKVRRRGSKLRKSGVPQKSSRDTDLSEIAQLIAKKGLQRGGDDSTCIAVYVAPEQDRRLSNQ